MAPTRREFLASSALVPFAVRAASRVEPQQAAGPRPTAAQLRWQQDELALFLHFGVNTFTDREWGDGHEDPAIFAPSHLDARQWARAAKSAGARAMILTAKHHDGFCLWPTRTTAHSVKSSPFRDGQGDVVKEFTDACHAAGLRAGVYLSPWDRHEPRYGDSPRYNDFYCDQLTELLTGYGPIAEVWFDGANGEGPNGRKQQYDWDRTWALVRRLQPDAVIFSDAGPDVRWIGNERGVAGETNWSTVDPAVVPYPGASGAAVSAMLQHGDPNGMVWRPGETDVSIRPGWFHHPAEDARVKSADDLVSIYLTSVGRNSKLLLNVPPTRDGLLHDTDVTRLADMRARLDALFAHDVAARRRTSLHATTERAATLEIDLGGDQTIAIADLREDIERGQHVARYTLEGQSAGGNWRTLSSGTTIGYRKIDRFAPETVKQIRLRVESAAAQAAAVSVRLFEGRT